MAPPVKIPHMYYCGCRNNQLGHRVWVSDGITDEYSLIVKPLGETLDDPDRWCGHRAVGIATLTHGSGLVGFVPIDWTVFAFRDESVDSRPGSHSTFTAQGTHTAAEMEQAARRLFPDVWARFSPG